MEQRKARRFDLRLPFEVIRSGQRDMSQHGQTRNLSSIGVLFEATLDHFRIGDALEYIITLPASPESRDNVRLHCLGKIVRFGKETEIAVTLERYEFVR